MEWKLSGMMMGLTSIKSIVREAFLFFSLPAITVYGVSQFTGIDSKLRVEINNANQ